MLYPDFNDLVALKDQKLVLAESRKTVSSAVSGNHGSLLRGRGLEFDSVREYIPGDDIRCIDWRVTARTGSPHLKIFREDRERPIFISVDLNAYMRFGTKKTFKSVQAAHIAAFLGWQGVNRRDPVSACLYGDVPTGVQFFALKRTRKSFYSMLKVLSDVPIAQDPISFEAAIPHIEKTARPGSLVYVISDFMDVEALFKHEARLHRLSKRCDVVFIAVNDVADMSISPVGYLSFCRNNEKITIDTTSKSGRAAYHHEWKKTREQLKEITSRLRIPIIELTTESDIRKDLRNLRKKDEFSLRTA